MGKRVGVLMGGWSEEREISLKTGEAVVAALESRGHTVSRIFAGPGLDRALRSAELDVAFLALHGRMGEDGKVQGLLELMGLPYTGSGVLASALAMNKPMAKKLFRLHNLPTPQGYRVGRSDAPRALELHGDLGFPCVVKPACGGSSVGLSLVREPEALVAAVALACRFGGEALVERMARGREVTVGILGEEVLGTCEIATPREGFDYEAKYKRNDTEHRFDTGLPADVVRRCQELAERANAVLGAKDLARIDVMLDEGAGLAPYLLEINTLPGFTPKSLLPEAVAHGGVPFPKLVDRLARRAAERGPRSA